MSTSAVEIERIVREVLAELGRAGGGAAQPAPEKTTDIVPLSRQTFGRCPERVGVRGSGDGLGNSKDDGPRNLKQAITPAHPHLSPLGTMQLSRGEGTSTVASGDLSLKCRIVTMAEVSGRLAGVHRLVVQPHAIVTPSVRDELDRRGIMLATESSQAEIPAAGLRLVLVVAGKKFDPAPLVSALAKEAAEIVPETFDCLIAATKHLAAEVVKPSTLGVLLTRHMAAGLCLANRHPGVRAVLGSDPAAAAAAAESVGANLLLADPAAGTFFQLRQIISRYCRGGVRECPDVFRKPLG